MKTKSKKKSAPRPVVPAPVLPEPDRPGVILLVVAVVLIAALLCGAYLRNRVYKTPVTLWADASSKSVNKRRTHENYGQALSTAGSLNDALREFQTVLALRDDGSVPMRDLYREIGVVYFRMGRIDDSITAWLTGLRYAPSDPSLLNNLSIAYLNQSRYDEAEKCIREALRGAPYMPYALNSLGEILMIKGRYEEALAYFLKAVEVSPEVASRYWNAAIAAEKAGRYDMALDLVNRYAALEPNPEQRMKAAQYITKLEALHPRARSN